MIDASEFIRALEQGKEAQRETNAAILAMYAGLYKEIGELSVLTMAQHSALSELLPGFQSKFDVRRASERIQRVEQQYAKRVRDLLERSQKMSKP